MNETIIRGNSVAYSKVSIIEKIFFLVLSLAKELVCARELCPGFGQTVVGVIEEI